MMATSFPATVCEPKYTAPVAQGVKDCVIEKRDSRTTPASSNRLFNFVLATKCIMHGGEYEGILILIRADVDVLAEWMATEDGPV